MKECLFGPKIAIMLVILAVWGQNNSKLSGFDADKRGLINITHHQS